MTQEEMCESCDERGWCSDSCPRVESFISTEKLAQSEGDRDKTYKARGIDFYESVGSMKNWKY